MNHLVTTTEENGKFHHRCERCGETKVCGRPHWEAVCKVGPCKFLAEATGELIECPTCKGNVKIKVRKCLKLGECTESRIVARPGEKALMCCDFCNLRELKEQGV